MDRTFIIAEAGVNHNGKIELAFKLIDAARESGADAVKFQIFKADKVVSKYAHLASYQKQNMTTIKKSQFEMVKELELSEEDFCKLKEYCDNAGIEFLTTPFDEESADVIFDLVKRYKISSGEVVNHPFLEHISKKGKPIILSTGMCSLGEVEQAIRIIEENQPDIDDNYSPLILMHCTTNYPCPYEEVNLKAMLTLKEAFKLPVGYSDHSMGIEVPIAAVGMGAIVIEKHFTLNRNMKGPDHKASLEPHELKKMIQSIRNIEKALGDGIKRPNSSELEIMSYVRKSIVAKQDIPKGSLLSKKTIDIKRPGNGISPLDLDKIIGMKVTRSIAKDEVIKWDDLKN